VNWRIPGWAAAAGAVISLAAGLAGGNAFGTILLRAVVSALLAGALGFGAQYVLRRYLPGFGAGAQETPQAVDILIDEEVPLAGREAEEPQAAGQSGEEPGWSESLEAGLGMEELAAEEAEPFAATEGAPAEEAFARPASGADLGPGGEPSFEPLEAPAEEELPAGEALEPLAAPGESDDGLGGRIAAPGRRGLKAEELEAQLDNVTKGQDPVSLAKAVRTFLRKDQEG